MVGAILRSCIAIYLILQILWTPIHVFMEPHSDLADARWSRTLSHDKSSLVSEGHDSDSDHERHSASQHNIQVLSPRTLPAAEMALVHFTECQLMENVRTEEQILVLSGSGLSPPELLRSWQFISRAALPVRAPSQNS
jgi:hypothetical protein